MKLRILLGVLLLIPVTAVPAAEQVPAPQSLVIGDTFTLDSRLLGETRRINAYRAPGYGAPADTPLPVLYMPDGGLGEDFLHIAGLLQVSVMNGTMRPFMLVGIENTERRRDLTGPTEDPADREIAPRVGGSAAFRAFLRDELMPAIRARYPTTGETAIIGESLAGLFVVETLLLEPALFDSYLAIDPSLWWNRGALLDALPAHLSTRPADLHSTVFLAHSDQPEIAAATARLAKALQAAPQSGVRVQYASLPDEQHGTVYHPAALRGVRRLFAPAPPAGAPATAPPVPPEAALALEGEGLRIFLVPAGTARPLPFGTARADTLARLEAVTDGPPVLGDDPECDATHARWPDGLRVWFVDDVFAGWMVDAADADVSTVTGLQVGSTRASLADSGVEVTVGPSSLGTEFLAGGVSGLLASGADDARVTRLWAGQACIIR